MKSIEEIQEGLRFIEEFFSRYNDWTSDRVEGQPIEICRYGATEIGEEEIVVLRRYDDTWREGEALRHAKHDFQTSWLKQALGLDNPKTSVNRVEIGEE